MIISVVDRGASQADSFKISSRVIAYYEGETHYPPVHLIEPLAKAGYLSEEWSSLDADSLE